MIYITRIIKRLKWVDFAGVLAYSFHRFYKFSPFLKVFDDKGLWCNSLLLIYIAVTSISDYGGD